jgi:hypothetical protein
MKLRTAGPVQQVGFAFALVLLACEAAMAADVERQIPVVRDAAGSGLTLEISREGTRQTATPFLTLNPPTVERIEERAAKETARLAAKEIPFEASVPAPVPGICRIGTPRDDPRRPEASISPLHPAPEEITVRGVEKFLKGLRASRKKKPAPDIVAAPPEQRLGRTDSTRH